MLELHYSGKLSSSSLSASDDFDVYRQQEMAPLRTLGPRYFDAHRQKDIAFSSLFASDDFDALRLASESHKGDVLSPYGPRNTFGRSGGASLQHNQQRAALLLLRHASRG